MAAALPVLASPHILGILGGSAAALWALRYVDIGVLGDAFPKVVPKKPQARSEAGQTMERAAQSSYSRWRRLANALGKNTVEALLDLYQETLKDSLLYPGATIMLSDAIAYWVYSDLLTKSTYDPNLNIPTASTFTNSLNYILDTIAALLAVDVISNRDVGSDIAESVVDSFSQSVVGDAVRAYLNTVAGVNAVDDDEIRDVVGEGAVATADELAFLGARSGLDTFSAVSELYTGLLQGDNPYWNRAVQEIADNFKRVERGLALDVYGVGSLIERVSTDLIDSIYWYIDALDYVINRLKTVIRDAGQVLVSATQGGISYDMAVQMLDTLQVEVLAYEEMLTVFDDPAVLGSLADAVFAEYSGLYNSVDINKLYSKIEAVLDDVGRRMADYVSTTAQAYQKLKELRTVTVQ